MITCVDKPEFEQWETYAELYDRNKGAAGDEMARDLVDPALIELVP